MAVPGIGTVVRYHYSAGIDIPAVVVGTLATWNSDMTTFYGNSGPTGSDVVFLGSLSPQVIAVYDNVSEGTSVGEFSLLTIEAEDV
jgi:hypothetical protein